MNLKFMGRVSERERAIRQFVIVKKQIDVSFKCSCPVIDNEFCDNIVKVVYGSTRLSAIASWIHSYFDNAMTKFMFNTKTDA